MSTVFFEKPIFRWYVVFTALFLAPKLQPQEMRPKPIVIVAEKAGGRTLYKVDSKPTGSMPTNDLLHALNQVAARNGVNQPVVVLVDSRLPSSEIWNLDGVAGKAQLTNLRFFIFFHDAEMMSEIKRMPAVPFSTSPPIN